MIKDCSNLKYISLEELDSYVGVLSENNLLNVLSKLLSVDDLQLPIREMYSFLYMTDDEREAHLMHLLSKDMNLLEVICTIKHEYYKKRYVLLLVILASIVK